jgi:RND family efflux transporter MFP subunit
MEERAMKYTADFSTKSTIGMAVSAIGLIASVILTAGCNRSSAGSANAEGLAKASTNGTSVQVPTVEVVAKDLAQTIEMSASVEGFESADLYAKIGGYLESISVDIGDEVKKDQLLAKLYVPEMLKEVEQKASLINEAAAKAVQAAAAIKQAEAEVAAANAAVDQAESERAEKKAVRDLRKTEFDRWTELSKTTSIERRKVEEASFALDAAQAAIGRLEATIRTAQANVDTAEAKLEKAIADEKAAGAQVAVTKKNHEQAVTMLQYAEIKAPFDAIVTQRHVHPGAFIQPATNNSAAKPLLAVSRIDKVRIFLDIPMKEVKLLDVGDRAVFDRINVLPGESFPGKVARTALALNEVSRMMRTEVDLDNPVGSNGKRRLMPGYYGYVTVYLEERPQTPVVPASALITQGSDRCVYTVENGVARRCKVTTNYEDGTIVGIGSGLNPGQLIVAAGAGQLRDGQTVNAVAQAGEKL